MKESWVALTSSARLLPAASGVYMVRRKSTGKMYIGLSHNIRKRMGKHRRASSPSSLLHRAINKHGIEDFEACVYILASIPALPDLEIAAIAKYQTQAPKGYNLTSGGDGAAGIALSEDRKRHLSKIHAGKIMSTVARLRMSQSQLGRVASEATKLRLSRAGLGRIVTESTRDKISAGNSGKIRTEETRRKISEAKKGTQVSLATREKLSRARRGQSMPEPVRLKISAANMGRKTTPETAAKISAAHTGKTMHPHTREQLNKAVHQVVLMWPPGSPSPAEFESIKSAVEHTGRARSAIARYLAEGVPARDGTVFIYATERSPKPKFKAAYKSKE